MRIYTRRLTAIGCCGGLDSVERSDRGPGNLRSRRQQLGRLLPRQGQQQGIVHRQPARLCQSGCLDYELAMASGLQRPAQDLSENQLGLLANHGLWEPIGKRQYLTPPGPAKTTPRRPRSRSLGRPHSLAVRRLQ